MYHHVKKPARLFGFCWLLKLQRSQGQQSGPGLERNHPKQVTLIRLLWRGKRS
jgi:hypothetical protein